MKKSFSTVLNLGIVAYLLLWVLLIASFYSHGVWLKIVAGGSVACFLGHVELFRQWAQGTSGDEEEKAWFQAGALQRIYLITLVIVLVSLLR